MHESENIQVERETSKDVHLLNFISTPVEPESNEWELETITQVTNMEQESGASTTLEDLDDALSSVSDLFENDIDDPTYTPPSGSESDSTLSNDLEQVQSQSVSTNTTANNNNIIPLVPYTDSDDTESELPIVTQPKNKGRKRIRNEKKWKKNIRKQGRISGKEHVNSKGDIVKERTLRPPCKTTCRLKCSQRISHAQRVHIHSDYYNSERNLSSKRQYIVSCITTKPIARSRQRDGSRNSRKNSHTYFLKWDNNFEKVCKQFFLNTLVISETFVKFALLKTQSTGMVEPDHRGKHVPGNKIPETAKDIIRNHISKYPAYESHYSRERTNKKYLGNDLNISIMYTMYENECKEKNIKPEKKWLFSEIFNREYNLSFHLPDNDTCDFCDRIDCQLKNANGEQKENLQAEKQKHLDEAARRYHLKKEDKLLGQGNEKFKVVMADLQKCLPTPALTNCQSFYLRKLWTLNYTIDDSSGKKTWCMIWNETTAGRGGSEMASCLFTWANEELNKSSIDTLTVWTDNCSGQNRNINMIFMYIWILKTLPNINEINHKFLLAGHTHMEVDGKHGLIERAKKHLKTNTIFTTNDWANFIASCSNKNPFIVKKMSLEHFLDFLSLTNKDGPLINRKKNTIGEPFLISNTVWLQVRREELGILYYKTSFDDVDFKSVDLRRNKRKETIMPESVPKLRSEKRKISNEKFRDLMTILQWVPEEYKAYFENLPHGASENDFPDISSTLLD
ncbi:uncharacterized protein LOC124370749 [Homalodisca vitripennis]|nr:uncharacterized protein LOC124370749 [Homalodisca vitripennis]